VAGEEVRPRVEVPKTSVVELIIEAKKCIARRVFAEFEHLRVAFDLNPSDVVLAVERDTEFEFVLKSGLVVIIRKKGDYLFDYYLALPSPVDVNITGTEVDLCGQQG